MTAQVPGLRRRIEIATRAAPGGAGEARAVVEDDYHHFRVVVRHDGKAVTDASAESPRFPYVTCPLAGGRLQALVGMALSPASGEVHRFTDAAQQCTHMLDLAGLAVGSAARGVTRRRYEAQVPDDRDGRTHAQLFRDEEQVLAWDVQGDTIQGPDPLFANLGIHHGFARFVQERLDPEEAEAALILRRCVAITGGRGQDLDARRFARPKLRCFTQQPDQAISALRVRKSTRDFTYRAHELCQDDQSWLAFAE